MDSGDWSPTQLFVLDGVSYSISMREGQRCYWGRWQCPVCRISESSATEHFVDEALRSVIADLKAHHRVSHIRETATASA